MDGSITTGENMKTYTQEEMSQAGVEWDTKTAVAVAEHAQIYALALLLQQALKAAVAEADREGRCTALDDVRHLLDIDIAGA